MCDEDSRIEGNTDTGAGLWTGNGRLRAAGWFCSAQRAFLRVFGQGYFRSRDLGGFGKDCAVLRAVRGADICETRGNEDNGMLMTMIESPPGPHRPAPESAVHTDEPSASAAIARPAKTPVVQASQGSTAGIESIYSSQR